MRTRNKLVGALMACMVLCAMFFIEGCSSTAAANANNQEERAIRAYHADMERVTDLLINNYRVISQQKADELYEASLASATDPAGKITAVTSQAIMGKKIEDYATIERTCIAMKAKIAASEVNMSNALAYNQGLREYFEGAAKTSEIIAEKSEDALKLFDQFFTKKKPAK